MNRQQAYKIREAILMTSKHLPDEVAEEVPKLFPRPEKGKAYKKGDRVFDPDTGKLVKFDKDMVWKDKLPKQANNKKDETDN